MTAHRYPGGIIAAAAPTVTSSGASGVWTVEEAVRYKAAGLWPDGTGTDPYFANTTLLLHGDGTNGAQNNTFLDSSTNNFTITRNGNTTQGSFSPYVGPGNWSVFLNGSTDYLTLPSSTGFNFGTSDFTIEAWIYPTARVTNSAYIISQSSYGVGSDFAFWITNAGLLQFYMTTGGANIVTSTGTIPLNTWTHVAVSRSGTSFKIFINGVIDGTLTSSVSITNSYTPATIGNSTNNTGSVYFPGYISNLRVVKGAAVYTSAFTPSTTPIVATTQTALLTCNNNGFVDLSAANYVLTRNGSAQVSKFSPFTLYQTTPTSYSGYFDGTGDYLSVPATAVQLGAQEFTFETWVYFSDVSADRTLLYWNANSSGYSALHVRITSAKWVLWLSQNGSSWGIQQSALGSTIVAGQWYHVAVVRSGNNIKLYVNGSDVTSGGYTLSGSLMTTYTLNQIGVYNSGSYYMQGSLSNFRIVTGAAVYTANFTPSITPLTATTTVTSAQSNSVSFDGTGDYLTVPAGAALSLSNGAFTVEAWIYISGAQTQTYGHQVLGTYSGSSNGYALVVNRSSGGPFGIVWANGSPTGNIATYGTYLSANTWHHIAVVRTSTATNGLTIYLNGVSVVTGTDGINDTVLQTLYIGSQGTANSFFPGFISNVRITKGQALYTSAFTPSTTPLTVTSQGATASNVSLLTCQDRMFEDNSLNYFAVTPNGDAKTTSMNPFVSTNGIGGTSYSGYFNGTTQYLTSPANAAFAWGTGDFTVELWFCVTAAFSSSRTNLVGTMGSGGGLFAPTNTNMNWNSFGVGDIMTAAFVPTIGQWYHLAYSRSGTSGKLFINGVLLTSGTDSTNYTNTTFYIGNSTANPLNAYVSNVRVVKGTAVYTAAFSPSTTPLTAISGTSLLTCQNTTFIDNSTNAFSITNVGTTLTDTLNPFSGATSLLTAKSSTFIDNSAIPKTLTANGDARPRTASPFTDSVTGPTAYTTTTYGGSGYFDGTGDYLAVSTTASTAFGFGTADFTVEAWVYYTGTNASATKPIVDFRGAVAVAPSIFGYTSNQLALYYNGSIVYQPPSLTLTSNAWNHVALVRSSGVTRFYVNGSGAATTYTDANNYPSAACIVGTDTVAGGSNYWQGYISNFRIVKGTAVYTAPFVPPQAPVTAVTNTQLLLNATNAGIFDNTTVNDLETVGAAQISTSVVKYGTGSMYFDGTTGYLAAGSANTYALGSGNFTVECWINPSSVAIAQNIIMDWRSSNNSNLVFYLVNAQVVWRVNALQQIQAGAISASTWTHLAVVKNGTTTTLYINGTSAGSFTDTLTYGIDNLKIGKAWDANYWFGYMDDIRITKGIARYTANFTAPTAPFPNI